MSVNLGSQLGFDWNLFAGGMQGLHNNYGSFNVPNMPGSLASRNAAAAAAMSGVPSGGVQQPGGGISSGRFGSNSIPVAMSQVILISYLVRSFRVCLEIRFR